MSEQKIIKDNSLFLPELENLPEPKKFWDTNILLEKVSISMDKETIDNYYFYGYEVNIDKINPNYKYRFIGIFLKEGEKITNYKKHYVALDIRRYLLFNDLGVDSLINPFWDGKKNFKEAKNKFLKKMGYNIK